MELCNMKGKTVASPPRHPRMTPQMLTLGRDDDMRPEHPPNATNPSASSTVSSLGPPRNTSQSWWKTVSNPFSNDNHDQLRTATAAAATTTVTTTSRSEEMLVSEETDGNHYETITDEGDGSVRCRHDPETIPRESLLDSSSTTDHKHRFSLHRPLGMVERFHDSLLKMTGSKDSAEDEGTGCEPTPEDALKQDCHFFYRDMDENAHSLQRPRPGWRARVLLHDEALPSFEYSQAITVLSPPVLQRYRTKFEQLNRYLEPTNRHRHATYDLELDEHDHESGVASACQRDSIVRSQTAEASSLFYYHHNGKMLMRLPRDQVRLLMDPDLEPGILSVEQWRVESEKDRDARSSDKTDLPPLRYVLTVNDDLYRMLISELSDHLVSRYGRFHHCFHEDQKMDIRLAIVLLVILLLILFITTEIWPTE